MHLARAASRELRKLDRQSQLALVTAIEALATNPRPLGVEKLSGYPGFFRIRVGDFRVVYAIPSADLVVICIVRDRKNSYKGLDKLSATLTHAMKELAQDEIGRALTAKLL